MTATKTPALEWPGRTNEEWQRSRVSRFLLDTRAVKVAPKAAKTLEVLKADEQWSGQLRFVDGVLVGAVLDPALKAAGVQFGLLSDAPSSVTKFLAVAEALCDTQASLHHYQHLEFGIVLVMPPKVVAPAPFLVHVTETRNEVLTVPHFAIHAGSLSQASLVIRSDSPAGTAFTTHTATTVQLDDGAHFRLCDLQNHNLGAAVLDHSFARLGRDAQFFHWQACLGGGVVKSRFEFSLDGEGANLKTHGLYFGTQDQHKDLRIATTHRAPHTTSYALYKGAVRDRSRTIFQGLIEVAPTAPGTDAYLSNKNLILNDGARADSLPQLKIDTNDVKCSHGSTTGKVNEDEVFYLMARGFSRDEARLIISEGLFAELIDEAPEALREELERVVEDSLRSPPPLSAGNAA
jgi:Fe-S cluster assembly protein SufD